MLKVATIGIGNAGNQIADLAMREKQIPGIAINSSSKDTVNVKSIPSILVGDAKGAGKNRNNAKKYIRNNITELLENEEFNSLISENEVIFVISSIGGGTGSGMAPVLTDLLTRKYHTKLFILVEIFPQIKESIAAQQNSIEFLKEVKTSNPNCIFMCYDNNKYADLPITEALEKVNKEIVEHLDIIKGTYLYPTKYDSIDEKDMLTILSQPGRLVVYSIDNIKEKDLDEKSIEDMLLENIKTHSCNVELDRDRVVKSLGIMFSLNENILKQFDVNIPKVKSFMGEFYGGFTHAHESKKEDNFPNMVSIIMSGLSLPDDRIEKIDQRLQEAIKSMSECKKESSVLDRLDTESLKTMNEPVQRSKEEIDFDSIFSRYD